MQDWQNCGGTLFFSDYEKNEIAADGTYKGKLVKVTGTVKSIGKDVLDDPYVSFEGDTFSSVQCMLDKDATERAAKLSPGAEATLIGRVSGKSLLNVIVKSCKF